MKKIMTAVFASALALALAAPAAFACSGEDKTAQEQDQSGVVAQEDKAANEKKAEQGPKATKKKAPAKVAKAEKKQQKKPVRISQK